MQRIVQACALSAIIVLASAAPAQAGIPIPCTGESIVKVRDLPNAPRAINGRPIALGYKFKGCFGGEWVGYIGSSTKYLRLNERTLAGLVELAGLNQMPAEPSRWQHPRELMLPGLWAVIVAFGVVGTLLNSGNGTKSERDPQPQPKDVARRLPTAGPRRRQFAK